MGIDGSAPLSYLDDAFPLLINRRDLAFNDAKSNMGMHS